MIGLDEIRGFVNSVKQAIGVDDPDLQHGRIGREAADKESRRAAAMRTKASRGRFQPEVLEKPSFR
jgi:hypothetical protein